MTVFPEEGRFCVLDIETAPAEDALMLVDRSIRGATGRSALHSLTGVSLLLFTFSSGDFSNFNLESMVTSSSDEADVLTRLDTVLRQVHDANGGLITFNGLSHDLPTIIRRAVRHWLFDLYYLPAWTGREATRHLDLMRTDAGGGAGRWFSLVDACAAIGVPSSPGTNESPFPIAQVTIKSQVDVLATFLLHLHGLSQRARSPEPLMRGWVAVARYLLKSRLGGPHLLPFVRHPHVAVASRIMQARSVGSSEIG